jgi:hypothetical protein
MIRKATLRKKDNPVADIQTANGPNSKGKSRFESWSPSRERLPLFDRVSNRLAKLFSALRDASANHVCRGGCCTWPGKSPTRARQRH